MTRRYRVLKRSLDVVVSASLLISTAPIQIVVAALVRRDLGPPVIFRQQRPGLHGELFTLLKFRTMRAAADHEGVESDGERLTPLGRRLRALSVDELPSLLNVLKGEMSLVGPRPLLPDYLSLYTVEQARRHEVRPGITGLAQVAGRNEVDWEERLALDLRYVMSRSMRLDLTIILRSVSVVLARRGISEPGSSTMSRFEGAADA